MTEREKIQTLQEMGVFCDKTTEFLVENGYVRNTISGARAISVEAVMASILNTINAVKGKDAYKIVATKTKESQQVKVEVFILEDE